MQRLSEISRQINLALNYSSRELNENAIIVIRYTDASLNIYI